LAEYFVDSSALVKRYVRAIGTPWVRYWLDAGLSVVVVSADQELNAAAKAFWRLHARIHRVCP
jgi:predicted nucleic acid-binding protein